MSVPVEDRLEIQQLCAEYAFRCDTRDYGAVGELFAEDGVWDESVIGMPRSEGRAQIDAFFRAFAEADLSYLVHVTSNHRIATFDGDRASGTSQLHVLGRFNGADIRILGLYEDEYVRVDGAWRFAARTLVEIAPSVGLGPAA